MLTINTKAYVQNNHTIAVPLPANINLEAGEYDLVLVIDPSKKKGKSTHQSAIQAEMERIFTHARQIQIDPEIDLIRITEEMNDGLR